MNLYPKRKASPEIPLDGLWDFTWLGDADFAKFSPKALREPAEKAIVPGVFDLAPTRVNARGCAAYCRSFDVDADGMFRINVGGAGLSSIVFVDGKRVAQCDVAYMPYDADVRLGRGRHKLCIAVDNRFAESGSMLFHPWADFYGYGGIYRSVTIRKLASRRIENVKVDTVDYNTGAVRVSAELAGLADGDKIARLAISFDGARAAAKSAKIKGRAISLELKVPNAKAWSPESPNLHTIAVEFDGDVFETRFGIRKIEVRGRKILLNGRRVYLKGVNRHEAHPEFGPVQPEQLMLEDLRWARDLGCNFVRCVHYPHSPRFFDMCDELGMLVWEESLGWGNLPQDLADEAVLGQVVDCTSAMIRRDWNHPSIIMWAFLNEAASDSKESRAAYGGIVGCIRALDDTRLVTYASNRGGNDICFDFADVVSLNTYPGWCGGGSPNTEYRALIKPDIANLAAMASRGAAKNKPVIFSESGACGILGIHDYGRAQWSEEFQSDYVMEFVNSVMGNSRFSGFAIWQLFDTKSYVNHGNVRCKPRGINNAGLLDEYRRPKLVYRAVKSAFAAKRRPSR